MTRTVPQTSYAAVSGAGYDQCWTPWHAVAPLLPFLPVVPLRIWEPCSGAGWLAEWLREAGHIVIESDYRQGRDALSWSPDPSSYDLIITNPPWSLKYRFIRRMYALKKPWALLLPYATPHAQTARKIRDAAGESWEEGRLDKRINYYMPGSGFANNGAQLSSIWLCSGLLPAPIVELEVPEPRPEHKLIKPPVREKPRKPTEYDILRWVEGRGYGLDVAALVMEALEHGVPLEEQASFLEAA